MTTVTFERHGNIGVVTLARPERLNAISRSLTKDLHDVLVTANADDAVEAIVWTGQGRAFCAGDDLKEFDQQSASDEAMREHIDGIQQITKDIAFSGKLVIGALHGYAVGGGFEWLLNCDLVVAADDLICFFPEAEWGQFYTGGVTHILPQSIGYQRTIELLVLGERKSADDLLRLGLVNRVVPRDQMLELAIEMAKVVATKSRFSTSSLKRLLNGQLSDQMTKALDLEAAITIEAFGRPEAAERVSKFLKGQR